MLTPDEYVQLKAFARQDGALLALLWVGTFLLYLLGLSNGMAGVAALLLVAYTPFFVAGRLKRFRDYGREGIISFRRGYAFVVLVFFYAGVLFAVAQYLYFAYMDQGFLLTQFTEAIQTDEGQRTLKELGMVETMAQSLQELAQMRPIDFALNMLTMNIMAGVVLGMPISLIRQRTVQS